MLPSNCDQSFGTVWNILFCCLRECRFKLKQGTKPLPNTTAFRLIFHSFRYNIKDDVKESHNCSKSNPSTAQEGRHQGRVHTSITGNEREDPETHGTSSPDISVHILSHTQLYSTFYNYSTVSNPLHFFLFFF